MPSVEGCVKGWQGSEGLRRGDLQPDLLGEGELHETAFGANGRRLAHVEAEPQEGRLDADYFRGRPGGWNEFIPSPSLSRALEFNGFDHFDVTIKVLVAFIFRIYYA
jgi:hypothetical protein